MTDKPLAAEARQISRTSYAQRCKILVPAEGFEPPTNGLQNRCSTPELSRLRRGGRGVEAIAAGRPPVKRSSRAHAARGNVVTLRGRGRGRYR